MPDEHPNDPLHGMTLKAVLEDLVTRHGWEELAARIRIDCFSNLPSVSSSLRFLRRTPWARAKVERLYIQDHRVIARNAKRNRRRKAQKAYRAEQEAAAKKRGDEPTADGEDTCTS